MMPSLTFHKHDNQGATVVPEDMNDRNNSMATSNSEKVEKKYGFGKRYVIFLFYFLNSPCHCGGWGV